MATPLTEGYRLSETQFEDTMDAGEKAAEDYANSVTCRDIVRHAPGSFDPRTSSRHLQNIKETRSCVVSLSTKMPDESETQTTQASFTITTMVEVAFWLSLAFYLLSISAVSGIYYDKV